MAQKERQSCNGYETFVNGGLMMKGGTVVVTLPSDYLLDEKATFIFENAYYEITKNPDNNRYYFRVYAADLETEDTKSLLFKYPHDEIKTFEYRR